MRLGLEGLDSPERREALSGNVCACLWFVIMADLLLLKNQ